jgi:hypothetical protein
MLLVKSVWMLKRVQHDKMPELIIISRISKYRKRLIYFLFTEPVTNLNNLLFKCKEKKDLPMLGIQ